MFRLVCLTSILFAVALPMGCAQVRGERQSASAGSAQAIQTPSTPPPATKMESFKPTAGSVVTLGYEDLGKVSGISVDVREMRDAKRSGVRGLLVEIRESEYKTERSFVDADEIPELLKGFDALLEVKANPTPFKHFEVRYTTKGELQLTAFNMQDGSIMFAVQTGRMLKAQVVGLDIPEMHKLRGMFEAAAQKLATLPSAK